MTTTPPKSREHYVYKVSKARRTLSLSPLASLPPLLPTFRYNQRAIVRSVARQSFKLAVQRGSSTEKGEGDVHVVAAATVTRERREEEKHTKSNYDVHGNV